MQYEVFEDNAGGLYLCILEDSKCIRIFENFEYGECGILARALNELSKNPLAYEGWDGDLVARLLGEGQEVSAQSLYENGLGDLIANSQSFVSPVMGAAGRRAMGAKY